MHGDKRGLALVALAIFLVAWQGYAAHAELTAMSTSSTDEASLNGQRATLSTEAEESFGDLGLLPTAAPLRWAYYYPVDAAAHESLRANLGRLDVVAPHWLTIDETGTVRSAARPDAEAVLRTANRVILPSVALKSRDAGHAILTDPAVGAHALDQLLIAGVRWDGLALDFEGLDAGDRGDLTRFIQALGASLRDARKTYAIALPAKTADLRTGWSGAYDYAAIADAADLYLVMAYGFRTSGSATPGSTAPLRWVESSMAYAATQIAPERLILGVPFYGYDWNVSAGPPAQALRHSDTRQLLERTGATATFDRETASATFRYELDGEQHEVWYEDDRALGVKLALVGKYGLRGAGAWRLGQEDPAVWAVWDQLLRLRGDSAGSPAAP